MADVLTETETELAETETKINCWEFKKCGREPGGAKVAELGVCPAAQEKIFDGIFGGRNSGRACWVVAGTFCKGEVQGTFAQKFKNCAKCEFFRRVQEEEGEGFLPVNVLMNYIDRTHEQRVDERTHELREAKEALEEANKKLEFANRMASRDMNLAARLQSSFFPRSAPKSGAWDVSFVFRPVSGVSGDFYDFYAKRGELRGVSLFDVSGHGIAPGLLTLLARSVIQHHFSAGEEKKLSAVIEGANRVLVRELDAIDNYLSGIMLRFTHNKVEYVNAGHTDLLLRRASSGEVLRVEPRDCEYKGKFLGVAALEERFVTVRFNMMKGDFLLLYTDCLLEARNAKGEEYGIDRVNRSLGKADANVDAKTVTDSILADLAEFTGDVPLKDDLTFVVVKRAADANWSPDYSI